MRRVRLANVATSTTIVSIPRSHPFTTSAQLRTTDNYQSIEPQTKIPEIKYDSGAECKQAWSTDNDGRREHELSNAWRKRRSWPQNQVEYGHSLSSSSTAVTAHGHVPHDDCHHQWDQDLGSEAWQRTFSLFKHWKNRRAAELKIFTRKADSFPGSGTSDISLSPAKGSTTLPLFNSFWNINFASISAKYNLAYPGKLRVGELFVHEAAAQRVVDKLEIPLASASNGLEDIRKLWESNQVIHGHTAKLYWWPTVMLWLLHNRPEFAAKFLLASYVEPYPPFYMVADSLEYLASYYFQASGKHTLVEAEYFRAMFYSLLDACVATRPVVSQKTIMLLVTHSTVEQSIYLHEAVQNAQVVLHQDTILHFAYAYAKEGLFERALDALEDAVVAGADPQSDSFLATCNKTLYCSVMHRDGYHASSYIISRFISMGVQMNQCLYGVLIGNALAAKDLPTAQRVFTLLEDNDVKIEPFLHSILLSGTKQMQHLDPGFEASMVQKAHDCAIRTTDASLATEILHCTYLHHLRAVEHDSHDFVPLYRSTLDAYLRYFRSTLLRKLHLALLPKTHPGGALADPTPAAINVILTAFLKAYPNRALHVFSYFSKVREWAMTEKTDVIERDNKPLDLLRGLVTNDYTYNVILMALSHDEKNLQYCTKLVQQMAKGLPDALLFRDPLTNEVVPAQQPTVRTWSILLHAFAKHGQIAAAEKVMELMKKRGLEPTIVTWNSLVKGYAATQDVAGAVNTLLRMEKLGFDADEYTTSTLKKIQEREKLVDTWQKQRQDNEEAEFGRGVHGDSDETKLGEQGHRELVDAANRTFDGDEKDGFSDSPSEAVW